MDPETEKAILRMFGELRESCAAVRADIGHLIERVDNVEAEVEELRSGVARLRAGQTGLREELDEVAVRLDRIEAHPLVASSEDTFRADGSSIDRPDRKH